MCHKSHSPKPERKLLPFYLFHSSLINIWNIYMTSFSVGKSIRWKLHKSIHFYIEFSVSFVVVAAALLIRLSTVGIIVPSVQRSRIPTPINNNYNKLQPNRCFWCTFKTKRNVIFILIGCIPFFYSYHVSF